MRKAAPLYDVAVTLTAGTSVQEFSKVFEGLQLLAERELITLRIHAARERDDPRRLRLTAGNGGQKKEVLIDIADDPAVPDRKLLQTVDVYFKRSFEHRDGLPSKIQPFGLNNPAISMRTALPILRARARTGESLAEIASDARQLFALPPPTAFEVPPTTPAEPLVLFQTRLWSPATTDPGREAINQERATLIRTLRASFGLRFIGGAVSSEFVRRHFPDVVSPWPSSMRAYPKLLRRPCIAVYSRGLRNSLAFKMSEYLAASRCIVAHAPQSELPQPLLKGKHYLPFATPDECIAQCEHLLSRPAEMQAMRDANWTYYRAHVEPAAHLEELLARIFRD